MKWTIFCILTAFVIVFSGYVLFGETKTKFVTVTNDFPEIKGASYPTALKSSHTKTNVKWVIPDVNDIMQCTDEELSKISIYCAIAACADDVNYFIYLGNRLMPERFKVTDPNK